MRALNRGHVRHAHRWIFATEEMDCGLLTDGHAPKRFPAGRTAAIRTWMVPGARARSSTKIEVTKNRGDRRDVTVTDASQRSLCNRVLTSRFETVLLKGRPRRGGDGPIEGIPQMTCSEFSRQFSLPDHKSPRPIIATANSPGQIVSRSNLLVAEL